jgi:hypothetical protein
MSIPAVTFVAMVEGGHDSHRRPGLLTKETIMKEYLLSVHHAADFVVPDDEWQQSLKDTERFNEELQAEGSWVFGGGLHPPSTATVVRIKDGEAVTTDGPYAETKEQLGGFWIVRVPDLDAALAIAERGARACLLPVEVRPFQGEDTQPWS